ncbi:TPA_asm: putative ATPase [Capsaspora MELD virus 2]|nr:TPA_asm: putative ATPase [Capsaspora MELD virus 2]
MRRSDFVRRNIRRNGGVLRVRYLPVQHGDGVKEMLTTVGKFLKSGATTLLGKAKEQAPNLIQKAKETGTQIAEQQIKKTAAAGTEAILKKVQQMGKQAEKTAVDAAVKVSKTTTNNGGDYKDPTVEIPPSSTSTRTADDLETKAANRAKLLEEYKFPAYRGGSAKRGGSVKYY